MKHIFFILIFLIVQSLNSFIVYANENTLFNSRNNSEYTDFSNFIKKNNFSKYDNKENKINIYGKGLGFLSMTITGGAVFGTCSFSYFIGSIALGALNFAIFGGEQFVGLNAVIMISGIIPVAGPWIGLGIASFMANQTTMVPTGYQANPMEYYGGFIAISITFGVLEIAGLILMIVGMAAGNRAASIKNNTKFVFFLENDNSGNYNAGLRLHF